MTSRSRRGVLQGLRKFAALQAGRELSDGDLLERFLRADDESAFMALVERHGPMVLGVCRRALRHGHDAEDACQAAFLVLARKAASICRKASISSWLHGVARRVAANLKRERSRRRRHELRAEPSTPREAGADVSWQEVRAILDEELERLPERYRTPLILCYLDGKTRDEAAHQLGLTSGSLHGRLERGRHLLRERLTRRGVTLSAALLATALDEGVSLAALPPTIVVASAKAAHWLAAGQPLYEGVVPAHILSLAREVLRGMFLTKLKTAAALVLCIGLLTALVGGSLAPVGTAQEAKEPSPATPIAGAESDEAFIRRLSKDLRGGDPTPTEVYYFVANREPGKRQKLVDLFIQERQARKIEKPVSEKPPGEWTAEEVRELERRFALARTEFALHESLLRQARRARQDVMTVGVPLNFRAEPWDNVFQWLRDQTLLPVTVLD
jgi:RNA polymerase sigma factor (sigma-70 family)